MKEWVLIGETKEGTYNVVGFYTDPLILYGDKVECCKMYKRFITAQVGNPPRLAPVSDKQLEEIVKALP